jgi:hypothetical protein
MHARSPKLLQDTRDAAAFIGEVMQRRTLAQLRADRLVRQGGNATSSSSARRSSGWCTSTRTALLRDVQALLAQRR